MIFAQKNVEEFLFTPGKFFEIPEFQRPYSWQIGNVREFLSDLEECVVKNKNHFFGTVVFVRETDNIDSSAIIDGQQRITTSLLMILAIYHLIKRNSSLSDRFSADDIKERYLVNRNNDNRIKLRTVTTDNKILQRIFDVDGDESKLTQQEKLSNLYQSYSEFREYFNNRSNLDKYISGLTHFEIVTIALDSRDDNPQRVFESINSTGKPLTDGDKIRNFALMLNNDTVRQHVYGQYWQIIERSLTDVNKDYITDFFRSYLISKRQSIVKQDMVYPEFKKLFYRNIDEDQSMESVDAFYGDILKMLEYYLLCKFEKDPDNKYPSAIRDVVFKMRYIQTELYIPFAISVLQYFDNGKLSVGQLTEVFKLIETYFSRRIVCNIPTTSVDRFLASLHKDVVERLEEIPDEDYVNIMKYLFLSRIGPTRMPSDSELENAIRNNNTYNQRTTHVAYILSSIDDQSRESTILRDIDNDAKKLTIEHIMPQSLTVEWKKELGIADKGAEYIQQMHDQYVHTLANLSLTGYNSEYSNRPFKNDPNNDKLTLIDKDGEKVGFTHSPLKLNQWIAQRREWNEETILERQSWWIENLKRVWRLPTSTYKPVEPDTSISLLDDLDLKGKGIRSVTIFGDTISVTTWAEALDTIAEKLTDKFTNFFEVVNEDEYLSSWIGRDSSAYFNSAEIYDTGYFIATGNDTNSKLKFIRALAKAFAISKNELTAELSTPLTVKDNGEHVVA